MEELFLGVMDLQEAKNHQLRLKNEGIAIVFKTNPKTCTSGCKVTVEVWGREADHEVLLSYFKRDFMKHVKGHPPSPEHLSAIFDPGLNEVICQACGAKFRPSQNECPDCGLIY